MELRCHGHSADNWAHSSSCRLNTIKPNNKHLEKLHTVSELMSLHIFHFKCHRGQINSLSVLLIVSTVSTLYLHVILGNFIQQVYKYRRRIFSKQSAKFRFFFICLLDLKKKKKTRLTASPIESNSLFRGIKQIH